MVVVSAAGNLNNRSVSKSKACYHSNTSQLLDDWFSRPKVIFPEVMSSHTRVMSSHTRVMSSHTRVMSSHNRVMSSHARVMSSHNRVMSHEILSRVVLRNSRLIMLCRVVLTLNPLIFKSDQRLISPYNIIPESHIKVMRIKEMITN